MRLNYKGKVDPQPGTVMGPSTTGIYYTIAGTVYDPETKMSEVWLDPAE